MKRRRHAAPPPPRSRSRASVVALALLVGGLLGWGATRALASDADEPPEAPPASSVVFSYELPDLPGKKITGILVEYEPGAGTPAHHHTPKGSVVGYVLEGAVRSKVDDGPVKVYGAGESWQEPPGAAHSISVNASSSEAARYLAIFVADDDAKLTTMDP